MPYRFLTTYFRPEFLDVFSKATFWKVEFSLSRLWKVKSHFASR